MWHGIPAEYTDVYKPIRREKYKFRKDAKVESFLQLNPPTAETVESRTITTQNKIFIIVVLLLAHPISTSRNNGISHSFFLKLLCSSSFSILTGDSSLDVAFSLIC